MLSRSYIESIVIKCGFVNMPSNLTGGIKTSSYIMYLFDHPCMDAIVEIWINSSILRTVDLVAIKANIKSVKYDIMFNSNGYKMDYSLPNNYDINITFESEMHRLFLSELRDQKINEIFG